MVKYIHDNYYIFTVRDDDKNEMWVYQEGIYSPNGKTVIKEVVRLQRLKRTQVLTNTNFSKKKI